MSAIKNNPFRILGLLGNSSERELLKQITTIKRFAEIGQTKMFDYDFPFWGEILRSTEKVQEAASKIEQAKNKVHYALFWFLNSGHIDETALNNLKEGHIEKATEIWEKTLKDSTVTVKNFAAISNLSTLQLGIVTYNGSFDPEKFTASIELKCKLIMSEACNSFITMVIGEGFSINRDTILKEFADEIMQLIKPYLNKTNGLKLSQLINAFSSLPNEIRKYVSNKFTDRPLNNIENQIEKTKQKRDDNPNDAEEYGEELNRNTKEDLAFLKNVWGANNVQYQMIVNKLANEILQCAIDFFIHYRDNIEYDPGDEALRLMKIARSISPTGQVKSRIDENIGNIQHWIDDKPHRIKFNKVKNELDFIGKKLEHFQRMSPSIANAKNLAVSCKPYLINMKKVLGKNDELYLQISSAVVSNAQGMLVAVVNEKSEKANDVYGMILGFSTSDLKNIIKEALDLTYYLNNFDMNQDLRRSYNKNIEILKSIARQFGLSTLPPENRINNEIKNLESEIELTKNSVFLKGELKAAEIKLVKLKIWRFFTINSKEKIKKQQEIINELAKKSEQEKVMKIKYLKNEINKLESKLKDLNK